MRTSEIHEIKGTQYEFCLIPPPEAIKILTRLIKRTLPSIGGAFSGSDIKGMADALSGTINLDSLTRTLASDLDEKEVTDTIREILKHVRISGREINFNIDFAGEMMTLLEVVGKALEVNYQDFFDGLKEKLGVAIRKATSRANQQPSTGTSGGRSSQK